MANREVKEKAKDEFARLRAKQKARVEELGPPSCWNIIKWRLTPRCCTSSLKPGGVGQSGDLGWEANEEEETYGWEDFEGGKDSCGDKLNDCGDACLHHVRITCFDLCGVMVTKIDRQNYLITRYSDHRGAVKKSFRKFGIDDTHQMRWLELWHAIDADGNNKMDFSEFLNFFRLPNDDASKRLFAIFSTDFNGCISFKDFFEGAWKYCLFDEELSYEFAFRMCSRHGSFHKATTILDLEDMKVVVKQRYPSMNINDVYKHAIAILNVMDDNDSGGIAFDEFKEFGQSNFVLLKRPYQYIMVLRDSLFGAQYWKDQTQRLSDHYGISFCRNEYLDDCLSLPDPRPYFFDEDFPIAALQQKMLNRQKKREKRAKKKEAQRQLQQSYADRKKTGFFVAKPSAVVKKKLGFGMFDLTSAAILKDKKSKPDKPAQNFIIGKGVSFRDKAQEPEEVYGDFASDYISGVSQKRHDGGF